MPKIAIARQRGALVVALVLVSQAVVVLVAPSAAAHHTVTPPPTSITLTTSKSVVRAGEQFTLIATTDKTVQYGSSSVSLFDLTANVGRGSWTSGSVFNANLTIGDGQLEHRYEAQVHHGGMVLATARVTVTHAPWVVTMTLVPEAAEWVTWRVTTGDQDVGNTGSVLKIVLVNKTTNQYMGSCNKTSTCAASDLVAKGEAREYQAHVA